MKTNLLPKANDPCWCGSGQKFKRCHKVSTDPVRPGRLSPWREVPAGIERPRYAETGEVGPEIEDAVKPPEVLAAMRRTGAAAAEVLAIAGAAVRPGVTTDELDAIAHEAAIERSAYPSPLNYKGFRKSVCTSVNEVVCHGIPDSTVLRDGDIVNIDVTLYREGVHGDTNATFLVGRVDPASHRLVTVTRQSLERGIEAVRPGRPISDIGRAIQTHAEAAGFSVVRDFIGHGIGREFHSQIQILHYFDVRASLVMEPGMTFTIEPMISMGDWRIGAIWDDGWTAVTADGLRSAQFEHTVAVTDDGVEVLTALG